MITFFYVQTSVLLKHLRRLRDCVSLIGRDHHEQLVGLILVFSDFFLLAIMLLLSSYSVIFCYIVRFVAMAVFQVMVHFIGC